MFKMDIDDRYLASGVAVSLSRH